MDIDDPYRRSPSASCPSACDPCRRRGSAASSTSRRRWTTSSASGWGSPTSTRPRVIVEAGVESLREGRTHYTSNFGTVELRRALSRHLDDRYGVRYDPATEILVTVGASEAVDLALRATCDPGDEVILHEPSYVAYVPAIVFAGGVARHVATRFEDDFALDPAAVEAAITPRTKALFLGYPCNPTGAVLPDDVQDALADIAVRHDLLVYSDEIYDRLAYGTLPASRDERPRRDARPDHPDGRLLEGVRDDRLAGRLRGGAGGDPRGDGQGPPVLDHVGADDGPGRGPGRDRRGRGRRRADAGRVRPPPPAASSTGSTRSGSRRSSRAARSTPSRGSARPGSTTRRSPSGCSSRSTSRSSRGVPSGRRAPGTSGCATRPRTSGWRRPSPDRPVRGADPGLGGGSLAPGPLVHAPGPHRRISCAGCPTRARAFRAASRPITGGAAGRRLPDRHRRCSSSGSAAAPLCRSRSRPSARRPWQVAASVDRDLARPARGADRRAHPEPRVPSRAPMPRPLRRRRRPPNRLNRPRDPTAKPTPKPTTEADTEADPKAHA